MYERKGKKLFWSIKNSGEILNELKSGGFGAPLNRFKPSSKIFTDRSKAVLLLWIFYVLVLSCVLSPYLCFIFLLYLDLYVLGDDALIS